MYLGCSQWFFLIMNALPDVKLSRADACTCAFLDGYYGGFNIISDVRRIDVPLA